MVMYGGVAAACGVFMHGHVCISIILCGTAHTPIHSLHIPTPLVYIPTPLHPSTPLPYYHTPSMPLAPACTLVLESSSFHDFPPLDQSPVIPLTGVRLDLPPEGLALQQAFEYSRLYPALTELCRAQEWDTWRGNLAHTHYPAEAVNDLLTRAVPWVDIMEQKRVEKAERKAALQAERGHREDTKWKRRRYSRF